MQKNKKRVWEIDFIRGLCVILMIIDHFFINMNLSFIGKWLEKAPDNNFVLGLDKLINSYQFENWYIILKMMTIATFLIISGISTNFSKNVKKRVLILIIVGILFTISGNVILPSMGFSPIRFGIINMFCFVLILFYIGKPLQKLNNKTWWYLYIILMIVIMWTIDFLANKYTNNISDKAKEYLFPLSNGFSNQGAYSDYAPICLYGPILFIGSLFGIFYKDKKTLYPYLDKKIFKPINFIGKYAIIFYVLQLGIIYLILGIMTLFIK